MTSKELGEEIRNRRTEQEITIDEVTEKTHLPCKFINMIESGNWEGFPSELHLKGSLKIYMKYLSMDAGLINRSFRNDPENQPSGKNTESDKVEIDHISLIDKKLIHLVAVSLILLILLLLASYIMPSK